MTQIATLIEFLRAPGIHPYKRVFLDAYNHLEHSVRKLLKTSSFACHILLSVLLA